MQFKETFVDTESLGLVLKSPDHTKWAGTLDNTPLSLVRLQSIYAHLWVGWANWEQLPPLQLYMLTYEHLNC